MQIARKNIDALVENKLPDGSRLLVDSKNERVVALNGIAGAAWDACGTPTTLADAAEDVRRSLGPQVSDEIVQDAILQLHDKDLITSSVPLNVAPSRRTFIARLGAAAVPLVVAMTMREQRAYAGTTGSSMMGNGPGGDGPGGNWPGGNGLGGNGPGGNWPGGNGPGGNGPGNNGGGNNCGDNWLFDQNCNKGGSPPPGNWW